MDELEDSSYRQLSVTAQDKQVAFVRSRRYTGRWDWWGVARFQRGVALRQHAGRLAATPNRLLESHPSLRRLKDGLVDAQLRTAAMLGMMSADHPKVPAAREAEAEIGRNLHDELASAHRGIEIELRLVANRHALLEDQLAKTNGRLGGLAEVRAEYANQVTEARNRGVLLERAEQNLAEARAARASAAAPA